MSERALLISIPYSESIAKPMPAQGQVGFEFRGHDQPGVPGLLICYPHNIKKG